jgi:hypothetical protein
VYVLRFARFVLICLLLGLVAVAAFVGIGIVAVTGGGSASVESSRVGESFHAEGWQVDVWRARTWSVVGALSTGDQSDAVNLIDPRLPGWARPLSLPAHSAEESAIDSTWSVGWPFRCVRVSHLHRFDPESAALRSSNVSGPEVLWFGLAADVCLFTLIALLVLQLPRAIRYTRRTRRGTCRACGYELRGSPTERCPECGSTQSVLVTAARRRGWATAVTCIAAVAIVGSYPAVESVRESNAEAQYSHSAAWFDELIGGRTIPTFEAQPTDDPQRSIDRFIDLVENDPDHVRVFRERMSEVSADAWLAVVETIELLAHRNPNPAYLELADLARTHAPPDRAWCVYAIHQRFPFDDVADRLFAALKRTDDVYDTMGILAALRFSWDASPDPARRDELIEHLRLAFTDRPVSGGTVWTLCWALEHEMIDLDEAADHLERVLGEDPSLSENWAAQELQQRIANRDADGDSSPP